MVVERPQPPLQKSTHAQIRDLEASLRNAPIRNANNLVDLLSLIDPASATASKAIHAVRRSFLLIERTATTSTSTFTQWLQTRRRDFVSRLLALLSSSQHCRHHDAAVASAALTHPDVFRPLILATLSANPPVAAPLIRACVSRFSDLVLLALRQLIVDPDSHLLSARLALLDVCVIPDELSFARDSVSPADLKRALVDAWFSVLSDVRLTNVDRVPLFTRLPHALLPHMTDPLRLADLLTAAYNDSDDLALTLAALDGLFVLISKHNLDYPRFYHRLYVLFTHETLAHSSSRHRFLHLAALFLCQGKTLHRGLVAAFVKRLVRRALHLPTAAALWCLRLALDLLYAHPNVSFLVHRSVDLFADASPGHKRKRTDTTADPFDDSQTDPEKSRAEQSSLWELDVLSQHLSPAVTRMVSLFSNDVRHKPPPLPGTLHDYAALEFKEVFRSEVRRKAKAMHVAYDPPGKASHVSRLEHLGKSLAWT